MKTILVIEDHPEMLENISEILQLAPYEVLQAVNGKEGIERARQTGPDLIICDIRMPELDGYGVLHILRKDPVLTDVPFIFLTAKAEAADFRTGMSLGADDYLTKPFDDLTLLNAVELRLKKGAGKPVDSTISSSVDSLKRAILETAAVDGAAVDGAALDGAALDGADAYHVLCDFYPTTTYSRKHRLFTAGSWPTALYFICRGKGKLFNVDANGNEYITSLVGPGDFVGYLALLEETTYVETAELLDDALVCTIPQADFMNLVCTNQAVADKFIRTLAGDVAELQERLLKLAYQSVRKRVAEALLQYQRKFFPRSAGSPGNTSLAMTLSRENWSHLVGASTETVIRILGDLRNEGLIEINASHITLLDIDKLTRLKR